MINKDITPMVSIGMPAYNGEEYICEALDSLLSQTFTDFELIISDDDSTDDTELICRHYADSDSRIRYIRQDKNLGGVGNFKFVLKEARGEYFMFASNDDVWSINWLTNLLASLKDKPANAAFGRVIYIDDKANIINSTANNIFFKFIHNAAWRRIKFIFTPHLTGKMILLYSLFPRQILCDLCSKNIDITGHNSQDLFFVFYILSHLQFQPVCNSLMYKRNHNYSDSASIRCFAYNKVGNSFGLIYKFLSLLFPFLNFRRYYYQLNRTEIFLMIISLPFLCFYHAFYAFYLMLIKKVQDAIKK